MRLRLFKSHNIIYILPTLLFTNEGPWYQSIDIAWFNWGISLVIKDA